MVDLNWGRRTSDNLIKVIVIDDDPEIRYLIQLFLSKSKKFEVVGVGSNGKQAIGLAREVQPDLVLLDVLMPEINGLEAVPSIRKASPKSKIVLLTMLAGPDLDSIAGGLNMEVPKVEGIFMKIELAGLSDKLEEVCIVQGSDRRRGEH